MKKLLTTLLLLAPILCPALLAEVPPAEASFPKVLIIGDSISLGFTPHVVQQLDGKAGQSLFFEPVIVHGPTDQAVLAHPPVAFSSATCFVALVLSDA